MLIVPELRIYPQITGVANGFPQRFGRAADHIALHIQLQKILDFFHRSTSLLLLSL